MNNRVQALLAFALLSLSISAAAEAQSLVGVTASGGPLVGPGLTVHVTAGQPAVGHGTAGDFVVRFGFSALVGQRRAAGNVGAEDAEPSDETVPSRFELQQNYPNPFNPSTIIAYAVPEVARVTLTVYDALGRQVATLVDDVRHPGRYEAQWDAQSVSSGVYLCVLRSGSFSKVRRMVVLK